MKRTDAFGVAKIEILIVLLVLTAGGIVFLPSWARSGIAEKRQACLSKLGEIGKALTAYLNESDQTWPHVAKLRSVALHDPPWPTLPVVLGRYVQDDAAVFRCPADERRLAADHPLAREFGAKSTWWKTEGTSYEWLMGEAYGGKKVGQEVLSKAGGFGMGRADMPLITEFEPFHDGDGGGSFNTLNADLKPRTARDNARGK